jgi:hypothetical protein
MKKCLPMLFALALVFTACTPKEVFTPTNIVEGPPAEEPPAEGEEDTSREVITPTITPVLVTSTADTGPGSLRQALHDARYGDVIQFDPVVFPPEAPATIAVKSELPHLTVGNVTLDASNAGVILDGSQIAGDWIAGLQIVESSNNTIQGLVIRGFPGPGILFSGNTNNNLIAGNQLIENERGIDMEWAKGVGNTITGNLIGTDAEGLAILGNRGMGIIVGESSTNNIIGPDNIIAYNGADGLFLHPVVVEKNMTFSNSLFGNYYPNQLVVTEAILVPTTILDFNFAAGEASGASCPNCRVRLFSTETGMEFRFEGETTADGNGMFSFTKSSAFNGPALMMTQAITPNGRFSTFSEPLEGEAYKLELQRDNMEPRIQLLQKHSSDLTDNRIAAQFDALGLQQPIYDLDVYPLGITRVRISINGIEPQQVIWELPEFAVHPLHEAVFNRMVDNGLTITYVLVFWDKETYPKGEGAPCYRFQTEAEIERYLDFVRFTVDHFKGRVQYYEIWNEPEIPEFCPKSITLEDYVNLVQQTVPVIRETDPDAKVVIGGVSTTFGGYDYLVALLKNAEIMPLVDVISFHPNYGASPEYKEFVQYYENYPIMMQEIKETAESNGFVGEYHADELTYRTPENAKEDQPWTYSVIASSKYFLRSVVMHLGMDVDIGLGMSYFVTPRLCTVMDEAQPAELNYMIENTAGANIEAYSFSSPKDNYMLGLWTEGIVENFDPGIEGSIYIQGIEVQRVTVIDILHGVEQELAFDYDEKGNLVIEGLMLKDYPLIIKLWNAQLD